MNIITMLPNIGISRIPVIDIQLDCEQGVSARLAKKNKAVMYFKDGLHMTLAYLS